MPLDYYDRRREQNHYYDPKLDRRQPAAAHREAMPNQALEIVAASVDEVRVRSVPSAGEQFREHSRKLVSYLNFLWHDMLPAELTDQWRLQISLLDVERRSESLKLLLALRESYKQAQATFRPHDADLSQVMRFEEKVPRIGQQIDRLIEILS